MRLADRLILRELSGPLINSILMFLMLLFASVYLFKITDLLVQNVPFWTVVRITIYTLPGIVTQAFPMGMLLGCLLAFGRLSGDSETVALFASGLSFHRIVMPVAWVGLFVSIIAVLWNEIVVPPSMRAYYALVQNATEQIAATNRPLHYVVKREGEDGVDEFVSIEGGYDAKTRTLRRVTILKMSDDPRHRGKPELCVYAEQARARDPKGLDWDFYECYVRYLRPTEDDKGEKRQQADIYFEQAKTSTIGKNVRMGRDFKGIMGAEVTDNRRMTFMELRDKINRERAEGNTNTLGDEVDLWEKISLPLASLVFGLVGAPLGIRPQRGSKAMGFGVAIGIIFLYWVLYRWMYILGRGGGLPPVLASFSGCLAGLVVAAILIARTRQ
jgi:lipopolysaccharide export system permease protein